MKAIQKATAVAYFAVIGLYILLFVAAELAMNGSLLPFWYGGVLEVALTILPGLGLFVIPYFVYSWLRKHQASSQSEVRTAIIVTLGSLTAQVIYQVVLFPLLFDGVTQWDMLMLGVAFGIPINFIFSIVGAAIARKIYDRRHSIVIE